MTNESRATDGRTLSVVADLLIPGYTSRFKWAEVWKQPISSGAAFEWVSLAAVAAEASNRGWSVAFPLEKQPPGPALFRVRNELPRHHGAQSGHSAQLAHDFSLPDRFLQAFLPKLLLRRGSRSVSVFREGCPYYDLMTRAYEGERPDILFIAGSPIAGFPRMTAYGREVEFAFLLEDGLELRGQIRVQNSPQPRCVSRIPVEGFSLRAIGLIECSVNKPPTVARAQLKHYTDLFIHEVPEPPIVLITGNDLSQLGYVTAHVPLDEKDVGRLERNFRKGASLALTKFGLD